MKKIGIIILVLTFKNKKETLKTYFQLYQDKQVFSIIATTRKRRKPEWKGVFSLGYDSDIENINKVIGHVKVSHRSGFSLRLAKDNALDTFRKGGANLILGATEQNKIAY